MNKKALSERDICRKFITPALKRAGWDPMQQIREEVSFTTGRIIVRGKLVIRGKSQMSDEEKWVVAKVAEMGHWGGASKARFITGRATGAHLVGAAHRKLLFP